jgi:glycosyltransferase involved in cell wall biosynthesis
MPARPRRLLIVGNRGGTNIGDSLLRAGSVQGMEAGLVESADAYVAPRLVRRLYWHVAGRLPPRLAAFNRNLLRRASTFGPDLLLTTGHAPVTAETLENLRSAGIRCANYSTDDPWARLQRSRWMLAALPHYDIVFTTRTANMDDLRALGCRSVHHLPFGYDPGLFHPQQLAPEEQAKYASEILFVGGGDRDRVAWIDSLAGAGLRVALYGSYWERYPETRALTRGPAPPEIIRKATIAADVALCLVRKANRDGHVMRSFEIPACGGCPLLEHSSEHREIFGDEGQAALYFANIDEMIEKARLLMRDSALRLRLAQAAHARMLCGGHTYRDRLDQMVAAACGVP